MEKDFNENNNFENKELFVGQNDENNSVFSPDRIHEKQTIPTEDNHYEETRYFGNPIGSKPENIPSSTPAQVNSTFMSASGSLEKNLKSPIPESEPESTLNFDSQQNRYSASPNIPNDNIYPANTPRESGIHTTYVNRPQFDTFSGNGPTNIYNNGSSVHHDSKKMQKSSIKKTSVIWLLIACIFISFACGAAGVFVGTKIINSDDNEYSAPLTQHNTAKSSNSSKGKPNYNKSDDQQSKEVKLPEGTVANAAQIAKDSVVEIVTEEMTTSAFFGQYVTSGAGSGVIIDADKGYIVTCAHVVESATSITVTLTDGKSYEAELIGSDSRTDIAVISIKAENLIAAKIGSSSELVVGETAIAIGNPLGTLGGTVSSGIISALDREITIDGQKFTLLQIDTSINPGNSGGGLFDIAGNLIGIVNAKSSGSSMSSTSIEGLGFAIPIDKAIDVVDQLTEKGYVGGRVYLGINVFEVTSGTSRSGLYQSGNGDLYDYITDYGVYFIKYVDGQNGDLMYGDRIVAIDGISVSSKSDISSLLEEYSIGDTVEVTVSRLNSDKHRSQMVDIDVTLLEYVPTKEDK